MRSTVELVDQIYEAAAVPEMWPGVLGQLASLSRAWGAALLAFNPHQPPRFTATENYAPLVQIFADNPVPNQRPERALAAGHAGFLADTELMTVEEIDRDPVYSDYMRPRGLAWSAGTVIPAPSNDVLVFDLVKKGDQFERQDMLTLDPFRPHLARAALIAHRLGLRAAQAATDALEALALPAAVLASGGRVLSANASFLDLGPRVVIGAFDKLELGRPLAGTMLRTALEAGPTAEVVRSIPLPATGDEPALVIHSVPIRRAAGDIFVRATNIVVVTEVRAPHAPLTEVLVGLFDLTPAEVRVARGIASGKTIDEIAKPQGLSKETIRSQLKAVLSKTGTTRQTELALLLSGVGPFARSPLASPPL